jgi:hypothetical protein
MTTINPLTTELVREPGSRRPASTIAIPNPSPELRTDVDPNIATRFAEFADACSRFSREIVERSGTAATATTTEDHTRLNLQVARTVFGKWSIDILAVLYTRRGARFQEIKKALGPISSRNASGSSAARSSHRDRRASSTPSRRRASECQSSASRWCCSSG